MTQQRRPLPPLNAADMERLALRYVERYATTRGRLADYLRRKIRERGWNGEAMPDTAALAQRMADLGYVDDRLFAESKAGAMSRRGLGARRVDQALRHAGVEDSDLDAVAPAVEANMISSAVAFARRKHIGPFARQLAERPQQEKQLAAMVRAGHPFELARKIVRMAPGDDVNALDEW
ncbi:RecX family transcriptional regulator [Sphingomonas psychrotolerans]|uniref:Regulatory protein RecX n=1 Tax=Sphingomonas psychrotolerans TaxID=1327635 RepID=A0ABU3MY67_9SPHN|nr:RecX family transcriptional regulator [Sphingomonas psychrotolerans]MDT8757259.1 RecX family transcriptional regulator [Sphingomonas psychrotolerans]